MSLEKGNALIECPVCKGEHCLEKLNLKQNEMWPQIPCTCCNGTGSISQHKAMSMECIVNE